MEAINNYNEKDGKPDVLTLVGKVLLLAVYIFLLIKYVENPAYFGVISSANFVMHEAGHMLFGHFGQVIGIWGGTVFQLIVPISILIYFYLKKDFFACTFALAWLSTNLFYIGTYAADAVYQNLPLTGIGGGEVIHDWNYLLSYYGMLHNYSYVYKVIYGLGYLFLGAAALIAILIIIRDLKRTR